MTRLAILLGFQLAWFATAFSVTGKRPLYGVVMSVAICAVHLALRRFRTRLVLLVAASAALGYLADTILVLSGALQFDAGGDESVPLWMVLLWSNLALSVDAMPPAITRRLSITAAAGAIGGPLSYLAGERFRALTLTSPHVVSVSAVAVEWAIAMPLLVYIERAIVPKRRAAAQ